MYIFHVEDHDESHAEYDTVNGCIDVWLGSFFDIWSLVGTLIHEDIHYVLGESGLNTTEKQDHYIMKLLLF